MLAPEFWQYLGIAVAGMSVWCIVGFALACFLGRVFALNRWDDDDA